MKYVAQGCIGLGLYLLLFLAFLHLIGIIDFHWPGKAEQSAPKEPTAESDRPALELESASVQKTLSRFKVRIAPDEEIASGRQTWP
jgi:hypothetical protein